MENIQAEPSPPPFPSPLTPSLIPSSPHPTTPRHIPIRPSVINSSGKMASIISTNQLRSNLMSPPPVPPLPSFHQTYSNFENIPKTPTPLSDGISGAIDPFQNRLSVSTPQSSSSRINGDVALTPTYSVYTPNPSNPHNLIIPQTPITSGPSQAKNSIKLQNCVSTVNLRCELKLLDIYCRTRFSEYNPSRFHGVVMKILEPRATALVFRSGKLVCTGTKNENDSLLATRKFAKIIQKLGFPVRFSDFKIQNLVATADLRFPIRLEALQQAHGQFTSYEPELFPGLVYRLIRPRIVLLIFVNGKIVFTGGKSREDITESFNIIYPILRSFRKN